MHRLQGRRTLVTGAAGGIGQAIVRTFVEAGATVFAVDRDDLDDAPRLAYGAAVHSMKVDLADAGAISTLIASTGPVDVLVNVAAVFAVGTVLDADDSSWSQSLHVNLLAPGRLIRAYLPAMVEARSGSIINISSVASSLRSLPERCVYMTTKAALIGLTKSVARDFVTSGIRCNAICPGTIETPAMARKVGANADPAAARARYLAQQPGGKLGEPADVAQAALYLASDDARFVTGAVIVVDGGLTARQLNIDDAIARQRTA